MAEIQDRRGADAGPMPPVLAVLLGAPRSAARPGVLIGAWLWLSALYLARPILAGRPAAAGAFGTLFAVAGLFFWGFVSGVAARDAGGEARPAIASLLSLARRGPAGRLIAAPLASLLFAALLLAPAFAGWSLLALLPGIGRAASFAWCLSGGAILAALAGYWLALATPAFPLQVAASMIEAEPAMETASRSLSYVRRRFLLLAGASLAVLLASLAATAFLFALLAAALAGLNAGLRAMTPFEAVEVLFAYVGFTSPDASGPIPTVFPHLLRLIPAFFIASLFSGGARVYLVLRRAIDGVPWQGIDPPLSA